MPLSVRFSLNNCYKWKIIPFSWKGICQIIDIYAVGEGVFVQISPRGSMAHAATEEKEECK